MKENKMNADSNNNLNISKETPDIRQNDLNLQIPTTSIAFPDTTAVAFSSPAAESIKTGKSSQEMCSTAAADKPRSTTTDEIKTVRCGELAVPEASSFVGGSSASSTSFTTSTIVNESAEGQEKKESGNAIPTRTGTKSSKCPLPSYYGSLSDDEEDDEADKDSELSLRRTAFAAKRRHYTKRNSLQANYDAILAQVEGAIARPE